MARILVVEDESHLAEGLRFNLEAEGYEGVFARHAACGAAARAGLRSMGFDLFADQAYASNSVTSALVPADVEWSAINKELRARGLVLAGGQGKMKGKIFRIGHLGDVSVGDIVRAIEVLEEGAAIAGVPGLRWKVSLGRSPSAPDFLPPLASTVSTAPMAASQISPNSVGPVSFCRSTSMRASVRGLSQRR